MHARRDIDFVSNANIFNNYPAKSRGIPPGT